MYFVNSRNKKIKDKFFNDSKKTDVDYMKQILTFWKPFLLKKLYPRCN